MSTGFHFVHEPDRCIKCYACEVACQQWHQFPADGPRLRRVFEVEAGVFPDVTRKFHSVSCRHCSRPPCLPVCDLGAIFKRDEDGIVLVDATLCDGCRDCDEACPFDIPQFGADGVLMLCDMCLDRLTEGKNPICTDSCPTQALRFEPRPTND